LPELTDLTEKNTEKHRLKKPILLTNKKIFNTKSINNKTIELTDKTSLPELTERTEKH